MSDKKQFPRVWVFDCNRRIYPKKKPGEYPNSIWREHWGEEEIVDETSRSWVTKWGQKIPKKGGKGICFSEEELDKLCWINDNRVRLHNEVLRCDDYEKLRRINEILKEDNL